MTDDLENRCHEELAHTDGPVTRKLKEQADRIEKLEAALRSIAANACCDGCREAALVARRALIEKEYETGERIREANDD
jgi:hypothetical protein